MGNQSIFVAEKEIVVARSDDPESQYCYSPSIRKCGDGSYLISYDLGGDVEHLHGYQPFPNSKQKMICNVVRYSKNWGSSRIVARFPICHARIFCVKNEMYILGHDGSPKIAKSNDFGRTWSELSTIDESDGWHGSACNVMFTKDRIYVCLENRIEKNVAGWNVAGLAPVAFSADLDADLMQPSSWKKSSSFTYRDAIGEGRLEFFGIPFFSTGFRSPHLTTVSRDKVVKSAPQGWLEGHVVEFKNPDHIWHDPYGKTFYILLRCNTAGVGYAALLKLSEDETKDLFVDFARAPSGKKLVFLPVPGGHNKFFIDYDPITEMFWLASIQSTDSARKIDSLGAREFGLPNNERHRLVLHFSKNCIDWVFAGVIAIGTTPERSRNYPAFIFDNKDLLVVARSGDENAKDSQYSNVITMHKVKNFRSLVY